MARIVHAVADPRTGERGHYRGQRVAETASGALGEWALGRIEEYLATAIATAFDSQGRHDGQDT